MTTQTVLEGKRVLICEDEGVTVIQLQRALLRAGLLLVGTVMRGEEAVELALREAPDLVLMDINLPGISGLEAARRIMAARPTCIVMLTANSDRDSQERALEYGASGFLAKPFDNALLLPALEQALQVFYEAQP